MGCQKVYRTVGDGGQHRLAPGLTITSSAGWVKQINGGVSGAVRSVLGGRLFWLFTSLADICVPLVQLFGQHFRVSYGLFARVILADVRRCQAI